MNDQAQGWMSGVKIVELSTMVTASMATMMLADQGASVTKVESTEIGDPMRYMGTQKGSISALFANCNRGKRSIAIDLKTREGVQIVAKLAADADVVVNNFRLGVMDRLGLGRQHLQGVNPGLIYVSVNGFGSKGPLAPAPAYDHIVQAHAGFTAIQGGEETPRFMRTLICDKVTAYTVCQGITAALYARWRSGEGQHLEVSMLDACLSFIWPDGMMNHTLLDNDVTLLPSLVGTYEVIKTKDGFMTYVAPLEKQRLGLFRALGLGSVLDDPRFSSRQALADNLQALNEILMARFETLTTEETLRRLREHDVPCADCMDLETVIRQEQVAASSTIVEVDHPEMGRLRSIAAPVIENGRRLLNNRPCPSLGGDSEEVLRELGYGKDDVERLQGEGIIRC